MDNPSTPIIRKNLMRQWAEDQLTGDRNDGESKRERDVGHNKEVVVDIFRRDFGVDKGTYFLRVSLRSMISKQIIMRYEIDFDKHNSEDEFLADVQVGGAALAEADNLKRGANWDPGYVAEQAREASRELFHDMAEQGEKG